MAFWLSTSVPSQSKMTSFMGRAYSIAACRSVTAPASLGLRARRLDPLEGQAQGARH